MGIPSYFSYVLKNHTKIIKHLNNVKCSNLFLDANSIIYDVINEKTFKIENIQEDVYNKIMTIIEKMKPSFTFIAFDGVVPLAKMRQQKQRRYKSWLTKQILNTNKWNTNAITPGTKFMNDLDSYLTSKFNKFNEFNEMNKNENKRILFSGSNEYGEGEQKIFEYIRNIKNTLNENTIIYGLDADLIMLSLLHLQFNHNLYLYRETKHFSYMKGIDINKDYVFNVDEMAGQINEKIYESNNESNKQKAIENYCFLCFLCGNDFLPHFPSINIRNNGIEYLIDTFKRVIKEDKMVEGNKIDWSIFNKLCIELSYKENELIKENIEWKKRIASYSHPLTPEEGLESLPLKDLKRENFLLNNIDKYYPFLFQNEEKDICKNYLQMIEWTWNYYNGLCKSNYIYYNFHCAPLFSSLKKFIPCFNEELVEQDFTKPPSSICQLCYVLPYNDFSLIPYNVLPIEKEFINLTETNFPIHYDFCKFFWESYVEFNYIDLKRLNEFILLGV
uniref:Xrn1 N-terminal domain-containing protein n=1 Tax=viral metagenome TaxID=1070528 RepID=A0A6C0ETQ8_9ZZZZ